MKAQLLIPIGKDKKTGKRVSINLRAMKHALLTASSGYGKTTAIRKLLEEVAQLPAKERPIVVVLDIEGEFSTLREVGDFALIGGPDGDRPADPRTAAQLARLFAAQGISMIADLSDESLEDRDAFTANLIKGFLSLSRREWTPILLIVDEADTLAPLKMPKGRIEPASKRQIAEVAARGRKRLVQMVLCTQRLAKLDTDARSECNLYLAGRHNRANDRKMAAAEFPDTENAAQIAKLAAGDFFVFGDAIVDAEEDVVLVRVDWPKTPEPGKGANARPIPPPKAQVAKLIGEIFAQLPARAQEEAESLEEANRQIRELQDEVRALRKGKAAPATSTRTSTSTTSEKDLQRAVAAATREAEKLRRDMERAFGEERAALEQRAAAAEERAAAAMDALRRVQQSLTVDAEHVLDVLVRVDGHQGLKRAESKLARVKERVAQLAPAAPTPAPATTSATRSSRTTSTSSRPAPAAARDVDDVDEDLQDDDDGDEGPRPRMQQRLLNTLAELRALGREPVDRAMLAAFARVKSPRSSTFRNALSQLNVDGLADVPTGGPVRITAAGLAEARPRAKPGTGAALIAGLKLGPTEKRVLLALLEAGEDVDRVSLAARAGAESERSSTFRNALSSLNVREIVEVRHGGPARVAPWFAKLVDDLGGWK